MQLLVELNITGVYVCPRIFLNRNVILDGSLSSEVYNLLAPLVLTIPPPIMQMNAVSILKRLYLLSFFRTPLAAFDIETRAV